MMSTSRSDRRGSGLLGILVGGAVLALGLLPALSMVGTASRVGESASRRVEVVRHAQALVEALARSQGRDLPTLLVGEEAVLLDDEAGVRPPAGPLADRLEPHLEPLEEVQALPSFHGFAQLRPPGVFLPVSVDLDSRSYVAFLMHPDAEQVEHDAAAVRALLRYV